MPPDTYTFDELCVLIRKSRPYVRHLQRELSLPVPDRKSLYPEVFLRFMERVVALRTFNVPMQDIIDLVEKEKKILQLLHFDSISDSPFWYMGLSANGESTDRHLLLTDYDVGFPLTSESIQVNLNFGGKEAELFAGAEMGEDVSRVIKLYLKLLKKIDEKVRSEKPVLEEALAWARRAFRMK